MDGEDYSGDYIHSNFELEDNGADVYLYDATATLHSSLKYPDMLSWVSYGLNPSTNTLTYLFPHSPSKVNAPSSSYTGVTKKPAFSTTSLLTSFISSN